MRLIDERPYDPPRPIEVELDGSWWPGVQHSWRLCDDSRGWQADVEFTAQHSWGLGKYRPMVPPHRIRLRGDHATVQRPVDDSSRRSPVT